MWPSLTLVRPGLAVNRRLSYMTQYYSSTHPVYLYPLGRTALGTLDRLGHMLVGIVLCWPYSCDCGPAATLFLPSGEQKAPILLSSPEAFWGVYAPGA